MATQFTRMTAGLICMMVCAHCAAHAASPAQDVKDQAMYRGPVDLVVTADEQMALIANQLSSTVSLVSLKQSRLLAEISVGAHPTDICRLSDQLFVVVCRDSGTLELLTIQGEAIHRQRVYKIGMHPHSVVGDAKRLFVTLHASGEVVEVETETGRIVRRLELGRWPTSIALLPKLNRIVVALSGESRVSTVDLDSWQEAHDNLLSGSINYGQFAVDESSSKVYFPWMIYRSNPITPRDIQRGWVLASRIARVDASEEAYREAISLDVRGKAMSDPYGIALAKRADLLVSTSSGTGEILFYRLHDIPFETNGGPGDLINTALERDRERFSRIFVGGRPMAIQSSTDSKVAWTVDFINDQLHTISLLERKVQGTLSLGNQPSDEQLAKVHQGRAIFYDARYSLDQWYSCHSCHENGGTNAKAMDTWNDATELTTKTVLPLYNVMQTAPWTWHGWQNDLRKSLENSFVSTMKGDLPQPQEVDALSEFLATLREPPNPFRESTSADLIEQGKELFRQAGCIDCHSGPLHTDGQIHIVGLESRDDAYEGYNTPSLVSVYRKPRLSHDGRSKSLRDLLENWHIPAELGNGMEMDDEQLSALIAYLKTL